MASNTANSRPYSSSFPASTGPSSTLATRSDNRISSLQQSATNHHSKRNTATTHQAIPSNQTTRIASSQHSGSPAAPTTKRRRLEPSPPSPSDVLASAALTSLSLDSEHSYPSSPESYVYASSFVKFPSHSTTSLSLLTINSPPPSRSMSPLSSSSGSNDDEIPSPHTSSSPSTTPPSSPDLRREIRHKGKQLKSRCTCCHVCRTSLKNYPRLHLECSECNAVVCQPCLENRYP